MPAPIDTGVKSRVIGDVMQGATHQQAADAHNVERSTVTRWMADERPHAVVSPQKQIDLGALVFGYVEANLQTLRAQLAVFSDPTWLREQRAGEAAILHGVIADKSVRLLELIKRDAAAGMGPGRV